MSRLDHLWAGWRSDYITAATAPAAPTSGGSALPGSAPLPGSEAGPSGAELGGAPSGAGEAPSGSSGAGAALSEAGRCVFCRILSSGADDEETHVVWRHPSGLVVALLNAYPYATGHLMVMPVRHTADLETLDGPEAAALWAGVADAVRAIKAAYRPDGLNVGANLGHAAGAGVPGHLHLHVLPRWGGDTNFMTSVAGARVLPEALPVTDQKLRRAWPA